MSSIMATERPNRNEIKLASKIVMPTSNGVASGYTVTPSVFVRIRQESLALCGYGELHHPYRAHTNVLI